MVPRQEERAARVSKGPKMTRTIPTRKMIVRIGLQNRGKQLSQSRVSRLGLSNTVLLKHNSTGKETLKGPRSIISVPARNGEKNSGKGISQFSEKHCNVKLNSPPLKMQFLRKKLKFIQEAMHEQGI